MKLMNVRLSAGDAKKVAALRERGVSFSDVVRQAVQQSFEQHVSKSDRPDADEFFAEMEAKCPLPEDSRTGIQGSDSRQLRAYIIGRLNAKRRFR